MAYQCVCGETFATYYMSYKHKKTCENLMNGNEAKAKKHVEKTSCAAEEKNVTAEKEDNLVHKCQMCNAEFSKRYEFEKHVEICDPFDIEINVEKVLNTNTNEADCNRVNHPVKERKDLGNNRSDKVNTVPLAVVEVDNKQVTQLAKRRKHEHMNDKEEEKKFIELRLSETNYLTDEHGLGSSKLIKRPNRKRKLKDFSDFITEFDLRNREKNWKEIEENSVEENFKIIKTASNVENQWQLVNLDHKYEKKEPANSAKASDDVLQCSKHEHDKELIFNVKNVTSTLSPNKKVVGEDLKCVQSSDLRKTEKTSTNKRKCLVKIQNLTVLQSASSSVTSSKNFCLIFPKSAQKAQTVTVSENGICESFMKTDSDALAASKLGNKKKVYLTRQMENIECKKGKKLSKYSNNSMNSFDEEDKLNEVDEVFEYPDPKHNKDFIEIKQCHSENVHEDNNKGLDDAEDFDEEDERNELEFLDADNKDSTNSKETKDTVIQDGDLKTARKIKHGNPGKNVIKRNNAVIGVQSSEQITHNYDTEGNVFTCTCKDKNGIQRANQTFKSRHDIIEDRNQKKELGISCTGQDLHFSKPFPFEKIDNANFQCMFDYCGTSCLDFFEWKRHIWNHSPPRIKLELKCCECGLELLLANRVRLKEHILMRHHAMEKVIVGLKYCQLVYKDSQQLLKVLACVFCGFVMDDKHFDEKHVCKRTPLKFYCLFCKQSDADYHVLQQHIADKHKEAEIHNEANLDKFEGLRTSMIDPASELDEQATTCQKCAESFSTNQILKMHVNETHAVFPFSCGVCRQSYGKMDSLKVHFKNVHILEFKCEKCGKRFGDRKDYERHIVTHSGVRPFKCKLCINSYADERSLKYHCEKAHSQSVDPNLPNKSAAGVDENNENFICELCGQCFQESKSLQRHIRQHNKVLQQPTERTCTVCSRTFKGNSNFSNHVCLPTDQLKTCIEIGAENRNSESIKEIYDKVELKMSSGLVKCKLCNQTFNKRKYLYAHIRNFHLSNEVKRLHCSVCNKGFEKQRALKNHMRIHSNSKPYQCRICKKTYRQLGHIRDHLLSHGSTRRFACQLCHETYAAASGIKNHVIKHCCVKPFKCVISTCDQKFSTMNELMAHLRLCVTKHKESTMECTMCTHGLNDLTLALKHLVTHKNDEVYRCEICQATNKSYYQLFIHKGEANHFTEDERKTAELFSSRKKVDIKQVTETVNNMDRDELLQQYDFISDETPVESNGLYNGVPGENNQEAVNKDTDTENIAEETFIDEETKILEGDAQIANIDSADTPLVHQTEENFSVTQYESSLNYMQSETKNSFQHHKLHKSTGVKEMDETPISMLNLPSITIDHEKQYHLVDRGSQFEKIRFENSTDSQASRDILIKRDAKDETNCVKNSLLENVCEDNADDIVLSEEMLVNCKILNEAGHIVNASYIDKSGHHVPIQCNVEMLQSLLNTGKYFLQYEKPNSDFKEAENLNVIATEWNTAESFEEIECTEFGNIDLKPEQYIFERPSMNDGDDNFEPASDIVKHDKPFKEIPVVSKCRKMKNMDKVLGEIVDKEAEDGSETIEEGKINYKIRLKYYEDRTKLNEEYPLSCDICNRRYRRVKDLNLHKLSHLPSNLRPYQCQHCGKGYTSKSTYKSHLRVHSGAKPFPCEECGKCFRQLGQLQVHLRTHTGYKPFKCSECQKCFSTNSALKKHIETHEQLVKDMNNSVSCGFCGKGFMYEKQMRVHQVTHMSTHDQMELLKEFANPKNEAVLNEIDKSHKVKGESQGNFMCDICGKTLTRNCRLEIHRAAHYIGEKVRCDQCGHLFKSEFNLRDHVKNVHSSKMYQCDFCGMELKKSSFKSHMAKHKGPAFQCNKCGTYCFRKERFFSHVAFCVGDMFVNKVMSFTGKKSQQNLH